MVQSTGPTTLTDADAYFVEVARSGELPLPHCTRCNRAHWYPRRHCPFCLSSAIEFRAAQGTGTIYAFTVMRRAADPYVLAYVELAEGPKMLTNIVDCDYDALEIGQVVRLKPHHATDGVFPMFVVSAS